MSQKDATNMCPDPELGQCSATMIRAHGSAHITQVRTLLTIAGVQFQLHKTYSTDDDAS